MIAQQINLYQQQFHPVREVMGLNHCLLLLVAFVSVLAIFSGIHFRQILQIEEQFINTEQQHLTLMDDMSELANKRNEELKNAVSEDEIMTMGSRLKSKRNLINVLQGNRYGNTNGFSSYLLALARQHVKGTWITGLTVLNGGQEISVAGGVLQPELAPVYLQRLSREPAFSGKHFNVLELSRVEPKAADDNQELNSRDDHVEFIIRTNNDDVLTIGEGTNGL